MDMSTGDIEDGPAFDKLLTFTATADASDGHIYVDVPAGAFTSPVPPTGRGQASPASASAAARAATTAVRSAATAPAGVVIIGAGVASLAAVDQLRGDGYAGLITVFGREQSAEWHHYDRTKLSKNLGSASSAAGIALRPESWWKTRSVVLRPSEGVSRVRTEEHTVVLDSGERVKYSKLLIATGASARNLTGASGLEGASAKNIFVCHDPADSTAILAAIGDAGSDADVVVIGGGFVGMEVASSLAGAFRLATSAERGIASLTLVCSAKEPLLAALGEDLAHAMRAVHEANGVTFKTSSRASRFGVRAESGAVESVELSTGASLPATVVIVAAGSVPNTDVVRDCAGIVSDASGIHVDEFLRADGGAGDVFAAGDVASFARGDGRRSRAEHWNGAIEQGRCAARNMLLDAPKPLDGVAFFSTGQFGKNIRMAGHAATWDTTAVFGDLSKPQATVFYGSADKVSVRPDC
jgi:3-phenylpropionate/trans-cinnamate dioxygenase ferredoxin reductase subunit